MSRYDSLRVTLGDELFDNVQKAKLLVVGAGGIGCELLKNLVLSGFVDIEVIDLDTIDVSNLNRQFLFRKQHVGKSKAEVARESVLRFNPDAKIIAHHGNIKTRIFDLNYFERFTMVLNALDNLDARKHVNRMCLAKQVPLIEAGSTGYLGQVSVIRKDDTECYECQEKPTQKVYPICTIRSTPDKPVHCIVWAKECFKLLFGDCKGSMLWEDTALGEGGGVAASEAAGVGEAAADEGEGGTDGEQSTFMEHVRTLWEDEGGVEGVRTRAQALFSALFCAEIRKKIEMKLYKSASQEPEPVDWDRAMLTAASASNNGSAAGGGGGTVLAEQRVWSLKECAEVFQRCCADAFQNQRSSLGALSFDKDDRWAMDFVTAAANVRAHTFHIPLQSRYDAKGIAGNIVPAIATTNAIIAGLQVVEALKIVKALGAEQPLREACAYVYCRRAPTRQGMVLLPTALHPPSKSCPVCGTSQLELHIDTQHWTLGEVVEAVLKRRLGIVQPDISIGSSGVYEEGEDADERLAANLLKPLKELPGGGLFGGRGMQVDDFTQDFSVCINVFHKDDFDPKETPDGYLLLGEQAAENKRKEMAAEAAAAAAAATAEGGAAAAQQPTAGSTDVVVDDDDDLEVLEEGPRSTGAAAAGGAAAGGKKRTLEETADSSTSSSSTKRARVSDAAAAAGAEDVCVIDD